MASYFIDLQLYSGFFLLYYRLDMGFSVTEYDKVSKDAAGLLVLVSYVHLINTTLVSYSTVKKAGAAARVALSSHGVHGRDGGRSTSQLLKKRWKQHFSSSRALLNASGTGYLAHLGKMYGQHPGSSTVPGCGYGGLGVWGPNSQTPGRIQKVDPLMGGSYKIPLVAFFPQIRGSTF